MLGGDLRVGAVLFFWSERDVVSAHASPVPVPFLWPLHSLPPKPPWRHGFLQEAFPALSSCPVLGWAAMINHRSDVVPKLIVPVSDYKNRLSGDRLPSLDYKLLGSRCVMPYSPLTLGHGWGVFLNLCGKTERTQDPRPQIMAT